MKQLTNMILIILILFLVVKCLKFLILHSSSKESQLRYYKNKRSTYLKRKEKAGRTINKLVNWFEIFRFATIMNIPDALLMYILGISNLALKIGFKELSFRNLIKRFVNFIYLRRYNPESIKANITRLEREIAVESIAWE